jgi:SAM-dependent methyltransferase
VPISSWLRRLLGRHPSSEPLTPELRRRIRTSFEEAAGNEKHFPSTIDPRIYHVQLILEFFGDLGGKRILDVGCGKGRFARILAERYPRAGVFGVDLAEAMLRRAPTSVKACAASMLALPFRSESFEAAYATESLEHAVDIETAITEMCRVLKPAGRLVIIDKNAAQWGKLETPVWERWFYREELEALLRPHCREVSSRFISYWEDVPPDGLFLAWTAIK